MALCVQYDSAIQYTRTVFAVCSPPPAASQAAEAKLCTPLTHTQKRNGGSFFGGAVCGRFFFFASDVTVCRNVGGLLPTPGICLPWKFRRISEVYRRCQLVFCEPKHGPQMFRCSCSVSRPPGGGAHARCRSSVCPGGGARRTGALAGRRYFCFTRCAFEGSITSPSGLYTGFRWKSA